MKRLCAAAALLLTFAGCYADPQLKIPVEAANALTRDYRRHELVARAAGTDCLVLLVRTRASLDDSTVETIHYGTGEPPFPGGIQQFAEEREFRAVAYRDGGGGLWTYGSITREEAESMPVCR